jgi:hypothetical protein
MYLYVVKYYSIVDLTASVVQWPEFLATDPEIRVRFQRYQNFWEVVGLEHGPLSLVSTIEELHGRKCGGSGIENREYGRRDPSRWPRDTLYPQKLALTTPTSGGRSQIQVMEFFSIVNLYTILMLYSN